MIAFVATPGPQGLMTCRPAWHNVWLDGAVEAVRDATAVIAFIFHWAPEWCAGRRFSDLMDWRDRALALHKAANTPADSD